MSFPTHVDFAGAFALIQTVVGVWDQPQNKVERAVQSNFADLMGRAAVHSGMEVTWEQMTTSNFQFYPGKIDDLNYDFEPPVKPDADGYYPVPVPGVTKET
jgi:hypothetical protein